MYRRFLTGSVLVVLLARLLRAQSGGGSIDVGTALLTQPTIGSSSVLTAAGAYSLVEARAAFSATGIAARTPNNQYTGQAVLTGSRYAAPLQRVRWELGATASGFGVSGVAPNFGWSLLAREHVGNATSGGFAGVTAGAVGQSGIWRRLLGAHAGGYLRSEGVAVEELSAAVAYTDVMPAVPSLTRARYADLFAYWEHSRGAVDLLLGGGARARDARLLGGIAGWGSGTATLWMTSRVAVVLSAGRALEDVARAVPSVRYLSLALRVGQHRSSDALPLPAHRLDLDHRDGHLEVHATSDSLRLVTVWADSASSVELMADFTAWEPVRMTRLPNGAWALERPIASGVHHVVIRIDDAPWGAPPNLAHVPDEFGGEVGLLTVP